MEENATYQEWLRRFAEDKLMGWLYANYSPKLRAAADEIDRLEKHVAELEERLAQIDSDALDWQLTDRG